ncbi:MAG: hypothetical protein QW648_03465 [Nanoarchaeales archaeon]
MVRSQFYILIVGIIIIILLTYSYQIFVFSKEINKFYSYYSNIARFAYIKSFLEDYQKFFYLDNSEVYPIKVVYDCNLDSLSINNLLNLQNVSIFDKKFNYLPTSYDSNYINFTIFEKIEKDKNFCIFEGYIVKNDLFFNYTKINGSFPVFFEIYVDKKIKIDKYQYLNLINNLIKDFVISFEKNCTKLKYSALEILTDLVSLSISDLNLTILHRDTDKVTLKIENLGDCPVDIRNFLYETNNFYKIIPNLNVNATSFVIYPKKYEIFNFSNFENILCLNSLGFRKCVQLLIFVKENNFSLICSLPKNEFNGLVLLEIFVSDTLKNPLRLETEVPDTIFYPDIIYPGGYNRVELGFKYICPEDIAYLNIKLEAVDTITGERYYIDTIKIIISSATI